MMFEASSLEMSSLSGHTSPHSSVLGGVTSTPLAATESRKHVASSEDCFDGTFGTKGPNDTSDRKENEAGVPVRPRILPVCDSVSECVGVDGPEE
jgi:hypothetical protein